MVQKIMFLGSNQAQTEHINRQIDINVGAMIKF